MKCWFRALNLNAPASDGSQVPYDVLQSYIDSEECKKALRNHTMLSSLTHRCRNIQAIFPDKPGLLKTVGKDDSLNIVDPSAPTVTHYITKLEIRNDGWLWAEAVILDEDGLDDVSIQNIRRLKGLIKNGVHVGCSCVILGMWKSQGKGTDILAKLVQLKGIDITNNSSWKGAELMEAWEEDEDGEVIKTYSDKAEDTEELKVKTFSDLSEFNYTGPKTSKIDGQFTILKAKQFSSAGIVEMESESEQIKEEVKSFSEEEVGENDKDNTQKNFSVVSVRDGLRERKYSPRLYLRRLVISYKQVVKSLGGVEKISEEDRKILESMLTSEVLYLLNRISDDVITKNRNINALLGCSAISKEMRQAAQNLQMIYRMSGLMARKNGYLDKNRYQRLQAAWSDFVGAVIGEVFKNTNNMPKDVTPEEEEEGEEK